MSIARWNLKEAGFGEPINQRANLWPDEKKRVVPGETCTIGSERSNDCCKTMLNAQESAEVIVVAQS